jgi:hypothetical protein
MAPRLLQVDSMRNQDPSEPSPGQDRQRPGRTTDLAEREPDEEEDWIGRAHPLHADDDEDGYVGVAHPGSRVPEREDGEVGPDDIDIDNDNDILMEELDDNDDLTNMEGPDA